MKPFQETNYIAKDKENEQWKSSLPPDYTATESSTSTILSQSVMNTWKITHTRKFSLQSLKKLPAISGNESRKTSISPISSEKFPMQKITECVRDSCSSKTASSIYRRKR